jgi:RNA polymerase sigma-70 factor (ECF subfamily)
MDKRGETCMTDKELAERLSTGDVSGLHGFFHRYGGYVAAVIHNAVGSGITPEDRDEVVADVFISLWKNASKIKVDTTLKPWLAVVARNAAINKARGYRPANVFDDDLIADTDPSPEASFEFTESSSILRDTLRSLTCDDQEIFHRFYFWHQTTLTISQDLGMAESTVRSRLSRGREKLRAELARKTSYVMSSR